uniref:Uncharacterized protein n=1 Tax=Oryza meridionalis TaxID=40149 RepID=A0A0E0BZ26_9ORYZ
MVQGEASSARRCGCGVVVSGGSGGETAGWRRGCETAPRNGRTTLQDSGGTRRQRRWGRGREEPRRHAVARAPGGGRWALAVRGARCSAASSRSREVMCLSLSSLGLATIWVGLET